MPSKGSDPESSWFAVNLVFECINPDTNEGLALEQRVLVIRATDVATARERAGRLGKENEDGYASADGNPVQWLFRGVTDVKTLLDDEIGDGTEVYYSYLPIGPTPGFALPRNRVAAVRG